MKRLHGLGGILQLAAVVVGMAAPQFRTAREAEPSCRATPNWVLPGGFNYAMTH